MTEKTKYRLSQVDTGCDHGDPYGVYEVLMENALYNHLEKIRLRGTKEKLLEMLDGIKKAIEECKYP